MASDRLTPLQRRILRALAPLDPSWTLTGGGALALEPPRPATIDGTEISVDSMREILVAKLTALLGRTELRDLVDVQALLAAGMDLTAALRDAPRKDGGFSAMTLAWVLHSFDPRPLALALGETEEHALRLDVFRVNLIEQLTRATLPNDVDRHAPLG